MCCFILQSCKGAWSSLLNITHSLKDFRPLTTAGCTASQKVKGRWEALPCDSDLKSWRREAGSVHPQCWGNCWREGRMEAGDFWVGGMNPGYRGATAKADPALWLIAPAPNSMWVHTMLLGKTWTVPEVTTELWGQQTRVWEPRWSSL